MRKYLLTGLLIWVPLVITLWVLNLVVGTLDQPLTWLPDAWQPEMLFGHKIRGVGVVLTLIILLLTGLVATNVIGNQLIGFWDSLLKRIPFFNTIYSSVKQVSDTLLASNGQAFRKALLVRYPHADSWTIAFLTGTPGAEFVEKTGEDDLISVYVPTTPNPTSGFFLIVARRNTRELDLSVDEALKYIISMGTVAPSQANRVR